MVVAEGHDVRSLLDLRYVHERLLFLSICWSILVEMFRAVRCGFFDLAFFAKTTSTETLRHTGFPRAPPLPHTLSVRAAQTNDTSTATLPHTS